MSEPKTAEQWADWIDDRYSDTISLNVISDGIRRAQEQAFEEGRRHEQHQTRIVPESYKKAIYDLARREILGLPAMLFLEDCQCYVCERIRFLLGRPTS